MSRALEEGGGRAGRGLPERQILVWGGRVELGRPRSLHFQLPPRLVDAGASTGSGSAVHGGGWRATAGNPVMLGLMGGQDSGSDSRLREDRGPVLEHSRGGVKGRDRLAVPSACSGPCHARWGWAREGATGQPGQRQNVLGRRVWSGGAPADQAEVPEWCRVTGKSPMGLEDELRNPYCTLDRWGGGRPHNCTPASS